MKTKKMNRVLKDVEAIIRVKQIMADATRNEEMKKFIRDNNVGNNFTVNIHIKNHKGGKVICQS